MRLFWCLLCILCVAVSPASAGPEEAFSFTAADVADRLVVLSCSSGDDQWFGSGFVAAMDGKQYIFTNQHVILGADRIGCKTLDGTPLRPRSLELSDVRNLARLEVEAENAFSISAEARFDDSVAVFGNKEGEAANHYGVINGVGADLIETSAEFTVENGGAPVLNTNGEVIGMASHVRQSSSHIMKEGTKFENRTRRFCQRFNSIGWQAVNWKRFNSEFGKPYRENEQLIANTYEILISWQEDPFETLQVDAHANRGLSDWIGTHNAVMNKYDDSSSRRNKYSAFTESLEQLSEICDSRARQLHLLSDRRELTGYLRNEFDMQAASLEYAVKYIKRRGDTIHTVN